MARRDPGRPLLRPRDMHVFVDALTEASRYFEAVTDHTEGRTVPTELLRPPDPWPFLRAFELATLRLKTMDAFVAYKSLEVSVDLWAALVRLFAIAREYVMPDCPGDVSRRIALAIADCQAELARLRVVYIATEAGVAGGWTVLAETADLPHAPDYPPQEAK